MPTHPPRACSVSRRRVSCSGASHQAHDDWRARRARRPYSHAERTYKAEQVKVWCLTSAGSARGDEYQPPTCRTTPGLYSRKRGTMGWITIFRGGRRGRL